MGGRHEGSRVCLPWEENAQNIVVDHLSRIERVSEKSPIRDDFPDDHVYILYSISNSFPTPWFANIVN